MKTKVKAQRKKMTKDPNLEVDDPRFAQMVNDPRFKTMRSQERKVKIDDRFQGMFTEKRFTAGNRVDKRGNIIHKADDENLDAHYELESEAHDSKMKEVRPKIPDARGLDSDVESSSSDEESDEEEEEEIDHDWGELDKDAPRTEETSRRLAVCNIDWDRIRAVDLFVLFNSFKPDKGVVKSVTIYPSEFGKKRMEEEKVHGPTEIVETPVLPDDGIKHEEGDAEQEYMTEKLRQYQLNRLKYYYAIVDCDSTKTAEILYKELDGFEYENSSSALDVRYVPDDMVFDEESSSMCTTHPDFSNYKAPNFVTTALQQSRVQMTWDETDPTRQQKIDEAFNSKSEQALDDLEAFMASSEEEEVSDEEEQFLVAKQESIGNKVCKYKQLLESLGEEDEEDGVEAPDMDISFSEVEKSSDDESDQPLKPVSDSEKMREKSSKKGGSKRKAAEEEPCEKDTGLELLLMEGDDKNGMKHFDYSKLVKETSKSGGKKKNKKRKTVSEDQDEDKFNFNPNDARFSKLFSSHLYNIDPSDPHFKNTEAMRLLMNKKHEPSSDSTSHIPKRTEKSKDKEVSSLVASIKRKTGRMSAAASSN